MPNSGLLFVAQNALGGKSLFQSDGSAAGTKEWAALPTGSISGLQSLGNGLAAFQLDGSAVWVTDGTAAGMRLLGTGAELTTLRPGIAVFTTALPYDVNGTTGVDKGLGTTDGVSVTMVAGFGTSLIGGTNIRTRTIASDLTPQGDGSAAFVMLARDSRPAIATETTASTASYVPAATPDRFRTWFQEVTSGGVHALAIDVAGAATPTISPLGFFNPLPPASLVAVGDIADWTRLDGDRAIVSYRPDSGSAGGNVVDARGVEPWVVSASTATLLADVNPAGDSTPQGLANVGASRVAFSADDGGGLGREVWITDGTPAGTISLGDLRPGALGSDAAGFTALSGGRFVFGADDGVAGRELWVSDGTPGGTRLLADLLPGGDGSNPQNFTALGDGRVAFTTVNGLWVTDGTAAGITGFGAGLVASNLAATRLFDGMNSTAQPFWIFGAPIPGTARDDALRGTGFNDTFFWSAGDDVMDGGLGVDSVSYREFNLRQWTPSFTPTDGLKLSRQGESDLLISINRASFIDGELVFDAEAPIAVVTRLYQAALGRGPDQAALDQGTSQLQLGIDTANAPVRRGLTTNELAASIIASADFQATHGASQTNSEYVTGLYTIGLGRAPDTAGLNFWTSFLAGGGSRAEVLTGFAQSAEMRSNTATRIATGLWDVDEASVQVARLYLAALDRVPELPGFLDSRNYLFSAPPAGLPGPSLKGLADIMLRGVEFNATPAGDDVAFVTRLYNQALNRAPEAAGLASWTSAMQAGLSRAEVLLGISESAEHIALSRSLVMPETSAGIVFA